MKLDDRIMSAIPLMAPVPTAWMIGISTVTLLHFPLLVAVITALTVEGIGFVSINTANEMREFNRHLNAVESKQRMEAPTHHAYAVAGLYLVTATLMTVVLHVFPTLTNLAPLPFILMTAAGGWLWALRRDHAERVAKWQAGRVKVRRTPKESDAGASEVRRTPSQSAKSPSHSVALRRTYPRKCEHCDAQIGSPNAVGAHMKKHHPELCKPKPLAVELFEGKKVQS